MSESEVDILDVEDDQAGNIEIPAAERLGSLVEYIAGELVDEGDDFEVLVDDRGSSVAVTLIVAPEIMGRMIGRHGRVAKAMRTAVMVSGSRQNVRASLDIEERYDDQLVPDTESDDFEE